MHRYVYLQLYKYRVLATLVCINLPWCKPRGLWIIILAQSYTANSWLLIIV